MNIPLKKRTILDNLDCYEFPDNSKLVGGVPPDTFYGYVSSTYLNGFINYVDIVKVILIERYTVFCHDEEEIAKKRKIFLEGCHCKLGELGDDVAILSKSGNDDFYIFRFDCDVSDCCIGHYVRDDGESDDDVISIFMNWIDSLVKPEEREWKIKTNMEYDKQNAERSDGVECGVESTTGYIVLDNRTNYGWISF